MTCEHRRVAPIPTQLTRDVPKLNRETLMSQPGGCRFVHFTRSWEHHVALPSSGRCCDVDTASHNATCRKRAAALPHMVTQLFCSRVPGTAVSHFEFRWAYFFTDGYHNAGERIPIFFQCL